MTRSVYWIGTIPAEDDFGRVICASFIDGKTRMGPWAIMTLESYELYGVGLGTGRGQKYQRQDDGQWLKVEG